MLSARQVAEVLVIVIAPHLLNAMISDGPHSWVVGFLCGVITFLALVTMWMKDD
jgi:hypothetical protein